MSFSHRHESHCRVTWISHCIRLQFHSTDWHHYGGLHRLFTSVAPGFAGLHWHPNTTGPRTTVASIGGNGENVLFTLPWVNQKMLHQLWLLNMVVMSMSGQAPDISLVLCSRPAKCWWHSRASPLAVEAQRTGSRVVTGSEPEPEPPWWKRGNMTCRNKQDHQQEDYFI